MAEKKHSIIVGNWKMNKSNAGEARAFAESLAHADFSSERLVAIAPPFTVLHAVAETLRGASKPILLAAQNVHSERDGAYTGEVSVGMLVDAGCDMVIIGHSERRALFGETDAFIGSKIRAALAAGLRPILCVGETLEQREKGMAFISVESQLRGALSGIPEPIVKNALTIAYEPVWAIGTGKTATPVIAQEMHAFIRERLAHDYSLAVAKAVSILYGGSVKPENASALMEQNDIDGALVGGASLDLAGFIKIINW